MNDPTLSKEAINDVHVQMWRHYDDLRQKKNATFLTANGFLLAVAAFSLKDLNLPGFTAALAALAVVIEIAWFLLLTRNGAYVDFHRGLVGAKWKVSSWTPRSMSLDRTLPVVFAVFWLTLLVQQVWRVANR